MRVMAAQRHDALDELSRLIGSGEARLFTGAGFSSDARDVDGQCLPDSREMVAELWPICFGDGEPDDSTLPDLYDVALMRAPDKLREYVARRLRIGNARLPDHYRKWFAAPWRRIYTLNIDDLEVAVQRQFQLPRRLRSISAIAPERHVLAAVGDGEAAIDVVHLNGLAGEEASELTFSTMQYAARLCGRDREYERLVADLLRAPFVFAGTTLDEVTLWQHLELHRRRNGDSRPRSPSFLISSSLSRARRHLLEAMHIHWVQASIVDIADAIL